MKHLLSLIFVFTLATSFSQGLKKDNPVVGTWNLDKGTGDNQGPELFEEGVDIETLGIMSGEGDWMLAIFYDPADGFAAMCLYSVKLTGNTVKGKITTSISTPDWVGKTFTFTYDYDKVKKQLVVTHKNKKYRYNRLTEFDTK
jgi:hypothetical protein